MMDNALKLIKRLKACGYEAYLVGGCVRDMLMGVEPHDFDITTSALPDEILGVFSDYRVIQTGIKHGTVTVMLDSEAYEITTFRCDGEYSDHRHPIGVTFSLRLVDDLSRRDFTVNAMAYSEETGLVDLYGGQDDVKNGIIRAVGDPIKRFDEDALRIIRAARFASEKGFDIEPKTKSAMLEKAELLKCVSAERIFDELKKLLMGKDVCRVMTELPEIISAAVPVLKPCVGFDQRNYHHIYNVYEHTAHAVQSCPDNVTVRIAALLHDVGKPHTFSTKDGTGHFYGHAEKSVELAEIALSELRVDNETKQTVLLLIKYHDLVIEQTEKSVRRMLQKLGLERMNMLLELKSADNLAQAPEYHGRLKQYDNIRGIIDKIIADDGCFTLKKLAVNGQDVMALGVPAGKGVGRILGVLLDAVIDGETKNEKEALLEKARALI